MTVLHIDFESASRVDLKSAGLDVYARDPSTHVHCMAYAFDDEPVQPWTGLGPGLVPGLGHPFTVAERDRIFAHVASGGLVYAHNVAFELAIWNHIMVPRYGWPVLKPEQCRCTMCMAYAMALPGSLENAAPAVGLTERKDGLGKRVMLKLCKPNVNNEFWTPETAPEDFRKLYAYCKTDVEVERALHHRLMELSEQEQAVWTLDYKINQNGILVDLVAIDKALALVAQEKTRLDGEILKVTGGVVGSCTEVQLLVKWIKSQGVKLKTVKDKDGKEKTPLDKAAVLDALEGEDLPPQVRNALELRKEAAKSSTAKLVAMRDRAAGDGRIRGIHQYHGASTGRWAGRGVQTQNLPRCRPGIKPQDVEDIISHLDSRDYVDTFYGPILDALSDSLRGMIIAPPGKDLVAVDFSNVEGRVLAWLAGETWKLEAFKNFDRGAGPDIYKLAYSRSFGIPVNEVTKEQRQIGKVMELALGYGGGVGAFQSMAKNYNVHFTDEQADQIKVAWRKAHPRIVAYWYELEGAAIYALTSGRPMTVGLGYGPGRSVTFKKAGSFLWCQLPSKRVLCYPYPEIREVTTPWGEDKDALTYMTVVSNVKAKILPDPSASGTWKRISTFGGSICENVVQATARDLMAEALLRLDTEGLQTTMHVHDEAVIEIPSDAGPETVHRIEALFSESPAWAVGLPIAAEGWRGPRYRKG